jgi:hypothetical protein
VPARAWVAVRLERHRPPRAAPQRDRIRPAVTAHVGPRSHPPPPPQPPVAAAADAAAQLKRQQNFSFSLLEDALYHASHTLPLTLKSTAMAAVRHRRKQCYQNTLSHGFKPASHSEISLPSLPVAAALQCRRSCPFSGHLTP